MIVGGVALLGVACGDNALDNATDSGSDPSGGEGMILDAYSTEKKLPSELLDLTNWKLTLPINTAALGDPDEIKQPELTQYTNSNYFKLNTSKDGVVFYAPVDGDSTSGSNYPRSELREMTNQGTEKASWSTHSGIHTMTISQSILELPVTKRHIVAGQIHDKDDDVIMIRLEGTKLFVEAQGTELIPSEDPAYQYLNENYTLGQPFDIKIVATEGRIKVYFDNQLKVDYPKVTDGCYFKAGAYTQSNLSKENGNANSGGRVVINTLAVQHE